MFSAAVKTCASSLTNDTLIDSYTSLAQEAVRNKINAVPGSGDILGVWEFDGVEYAFRNNRLGTAADMYKSTSSGWDICDLGEYLQFTSGTTAFSVGETVSQGSVSATVSKVVVRTGSWAGNDAAGYLSLTNRTGGVFSSGAITGGSGAATASGIQTANTLNPGGRFEFVNYNFSGTSSGLRMYGCDGVSVPFEWDGSTFAPVITGSSGYPDHITAHAHHLFLAYPGGSLQHSGTGEPHKWSAAAAASEIGVGQEINGMVSQANVLAIFCDNKIDLLYGTSTSDWVRRTLTAAMGAVEYTIQQLRGRTFFMSEQGLSTLSAVQEYGDFSADPLSEDIQSLIDDKRGLAVASVVVRSKDQYRIFFSDGVGINYTAGKGFTRFNYGVTVTCAGAVGSGSSETVLFGDDDGYVYQLEKGASFDGTDVEGVLLIPFNHLKSPSHKKRFRKITIECDQVSSLYFVPDFSYGSPHYPTPIGQTVTVSSGSGGYWGVGDWEDFYWSEQVVGEAYAQINGVGQNIAVYISSSGGGVHTLQGVLLHYDVRGIQR